VYLYGTLTSREGRIWNNQKVNQKLFLDNYSLYLVEEFKYDADDDTQEMALV
jgi:hypothetical protein